MVTTSIDTGFEPPFAAGSKFVSTEVAGRDLVADTSIMFSLVAGGTLSVYAGCSQMSGEYTIVDGQLVVPGLSRDDIGCDPARIDQDTWLRDLLFSRPTITSDGDLLIIRGAAATITMIDDDIAHPDLPLVGTTWVFSGFVDELGESMLFALQSATIVFDDANGGAYTVDTGCNKGSGTATVHGDKLTITAVSWSGLSCSGDMDQAERKLLEVFAGDLQFAIDGGTLTLTRTDDRGLRLRAPS